MSTYQDNVCTRDLIGLLLLTSYLDTGVHVHRFVSIS